MDESRHALTESALDRELQRALAVDPSPDFAARVRMRVANGTMSAPWWTLRGYYGAGAVAVASAVVLVMMVGSRPQSPPAPAIVTHSARSGAGTGSDRARQETYVASGSHRTRQQTYVVSGSDRTGQETHAVSGFSRTAAVHRGRPERRRDAPDVIVDPAEQRAFREFVDAAEASRVPVAPLVTDSDAAEEGSIVPPAIEIPPIEIEPLPQVAQLEGERQ